MKILADEGVPVPLLRTFPNAWSVDTVKGLGWGGKSDAEVLKLAEGNGFEIFVTTDKNIVYQQNTKKLKIKVYALSTPSWPKLKVQLKEIIQNLWELCSERKDIVDLDIDQ